MYSRLHIQDRGKFAKIGPFEKNGAGGLAVVILAAGASRRMGADKSRLWFTETETFLDHILAVYASLSCRTIVVRASAAETTLPCRTAPTDGTTVVIFNDNPTGDRLSSLLRGLGEVPAGEYLFVQDVDRPFITPGVLHRLLAHRHPTGYTAPDIGGHAGHPVLLSPVVVEALRERTSAVTLRDALRGFDRALVGVTAPDCDININTPQEYERHILPGAGHVRPD
jgi:CTP:molybdopterin cytidylyltransferase MocA